MASDDQTHRPLKFYGLNDYGTYFEIARAAEVFNNFDAACPPSSIAGILELYNAQLFVEKNLFPSVYTEAQRIAAQARIPEIRKAIAKFFNKINEANLAASCRRR